MASTVIINRQPDVQCSVTPLFLEENISCLFAFECFAERESKGESVKSPGQWETQTWDLASVLWPCLLIKCQTYFSTPEKKKAYILGLRLPEGDGNTHFAPVGWLLCVSVFVGGRVCMRIKVRSIIRDAAVWVALSHEYFIKLWT